MKNIIIAVIVMFLATGCKSQKTTTSTDETKPKQGERAGQPSTDEIFNKMDANSDEKLSKSEVEGPLQRDFSKIDSNGDGFITKAELENAPKPQRGQRPPRN